MAAFADRLCIACRFGTGAHYGMTAGADTCAFFLTIRPAGLTAIENDDHDPSYRQHTGAVCTAVSTNSASAFSVGGMRGPAGARP